MKVLNDLLIIDLKCGIQNARVEQIITQPSPKVPTRRQFHTSNVIGDKMYVFGGGDGKHWLSDLMYFDFKREEWVIPEQSGEIPEGRLQHSSFV